MLQLCHIISKYKVFLLLQDDMNLGENKRIPIRKLDDLTRKQMLANHFKRIEETQVATHGGEVGRDFTSRMWKSEVNLINSNAF